MFDINAITSKIIFPTILSILDLITFAGLALILILINYQISMVIILSFFLFAYFYIYFFKKKLSHHGNLRLNSDKKKIKTLVETLNLIELVSIKNKTKESNNKDGTLAYRRRRP